MVRVTPFLPLISGASTLLAPTGTDSRQESYASLTGYAKRDLLTCEQTYGANWIQCGDAGSTFCYNPSEGQTCCAQDAGYCDAGTWCAPVPGFCCLDGEDAAACAREAGFELPGASSSGGVDTTVSSTTTTTRTSSTTLTASSTTLTTLSPAGSSTAAQGVTSAPSTTSDGGLTWSSIYPTSTGFGAQSNGSSSTNSTAALPSPSYVQISDAKKEQWTLVWMTVAMGLLGVFMASC
ncbi:hypothetical protein NKR19_g4331 [Coniochaeta hoffmannii]|uniref:Uncharacterized protein n=1 Tax=Coniochaeta hoffmannii TaxID=91930 RepID=A0AA38RSK2_9PEZI|nr:hypothetical protein NKR19_g4331 [Coniochaeta hoffmannii]